ncbi:MAG TPA: hypothetical protein VHD33_00445 [Legionellaceae bacterium]|nr:hypothetical protein [Legionellaceae bacterium]
MVMPQAQCVAQAVELARPSKNAMDYLVVTLNAKITHYRVQEEYEPILKAVDESVKISEIRYQFLNEISQKTWTATATTIDLEKIKTSPADYLMVPAREGIEKISESMGQVSDITMVYYIDENAQFNRGYIVNDQIVDESNPEHLKMMQVLDQMFHAWLVSHDLASDTNGIIYKRKKDGDLGEKVDPTILLEILNDPETGFQNTVAKVDPDIHLTMLWTPPEGPEDLEMAEDTDEMAHSQQSSQAKGG